MWKQYFIPKDLCEALQIIEQFQNRARIVAGGTDLVLDFTSHRNSSIEALVDISSISELKRITVVDNRIHIGSAVTLSQILASEMLRSRVPVLVDAVRTIAGPQIRNIATLGGNVVNASPAADTIPSLLVLDAMVSIRGQDSKSRNIPLCEFLLGNRKVNLDPDEIVTEVNFSVPHLLARHYFRKVQPRRSMAIALLNLAILLHVEDQMILDTRIAMGAVAPTAIRIKTIEGKLKHLSTSSALLSTVYAGVKDDISPITDFRASLQYRLSMAEQLLEESISELLEKERPLNGVCR